MNPNRQLKIYRRDGTPYPEPPGGWYKSSVRSAKEVGTGGDPAPQESAGELWGDKLERYLKLAGISQEKYKAVKKKLGFSEECGCLERKQSLNLFNQRVDKVGWGRAVYEIIRSA